MFIMQYDITLPADYDMGIIRDRVAKGGPSFDSFPGLGLECFLVAEKEAFQQRLDAAEQPGGTCGFEVLHASAPALGELAP